MKRLILLLLTTIAVGMAAQATEPFNVCPRCHGLGYLRSFGSSTQTDCPNCDGGRVPLTQRERDEMQRQVDNSVRMMEMNNLTPAEQIRFEELIKESMTPVPIYQGCTACDSTGKCKACGGLITITLDYDGCPVCGGGGRCITCNGRGYFHLGYRENPNKAQLVRQAQDILRSGQERRQRGENAFGMVNTPGTYNPNATGGTSTGGTIEPDDDDDDDDDDDSGSSNRRGGVGLGYILGGVCGAGVFGWLAFRYFRR